MRQKPWVLAILLGTSHALGQTATSPRPNMAATVSQAARPAVVSPRAPGTPTLPAAPELPGSPSGLPEPGLFPVVPQIENVTTFDNRVLDLRWQNGRWDLVAGPVALKDFGKRQADAQEALQILRELGVNQRGTIGTPSPVMEYWLVDGQAPRSLGTRSRMISIDPDFLRVEQVQGRWTLRDDRQALFQFGQHQEDAQKALEVIRRHGFTQIGYVGQPAVLLYFLSGAKKANRSMTEATKTLVPRRSLPGTGTRPEANTLAQIGAPPGSPLVAAGLPSGRQLSPGNPLLPDFQALGERVPIDWQQVQLNSDGKDWKLGFGGYTLANFGPDERAARQALAAIRYYRFTEQCFVRGTTAPFTYYLTNGQAPRGQMLGLIAEPVHTEALKVQQQGSEFVLTSGDRPLLHFGENEREGRAFLRQIQQYRFDRLCTIGAGGPTPMTFFLKSR